MPQQFLEAFEPGAEDEMIDFGAGVAVVKRPLSPSEPDLTGELCDDRVPGVMAFGWLCLALGNAILDDHFDDLRSWLQGRDQPERTVVGRSFLRSYAPHHFLAKRAMEREVVVQIHLFGGLIYEVRIGVIRYGGDCPVYLENLKEGKSLLAPSEARSQPGALCRAQPMNYSYRDALREDAFQQLPLINQEKLRREAKERGIALPLGSGLLDLLEELDEAGAFCPIGFSEESGEVVLIRAVGSVATESTIVSACIESRAPSPDVQGITGTGRSLW